MGRRYPLNIILIGVDAGLYGVLIGVISVAYTIESVFIAAGITCVTVFIVTAFAFWTNIDFTKCLGFIAVLGWFFLPNVLFTLNSQQEFFSSSLAPSLPLSPGVVW